MADCIFHRSVDDVGIFGCAFCLYSVNKEVNKPTNEYVGQQDGVKLR